jgi:hypothetical protein
MAQFVCVRLVQANALDLSLFQFDYDLTFSAFFLNADRTVYGRFGSRSERENATKDMSIEGFRKAMAAALELHRKYPSNRNALAAKRDLEVRFKVPDEFPTLHGKYRPELDYEGKVVQSCMHCHQVREAERKVYRAENKTIPDRVLYPWPIPDVIGLSLDPKEKATVRAVIAGSAAERAGFRAGDELLTLQGQPLLSIADVQWVLQHAGEPDTLQALVRRDSQPVHLALALEKDWRRHTDISWRVSTWDLRRMALGGLLLKDAPQQKRAAARLASDALALEVAHVGEYGEHAVAKKAGFKKDDLIVRVDNLNTRRTESELLGYLLQRRMPGDRVPFIVLRDGEQVELELMIPLPSRSE